MGEPRSAVGSAGPSGGECAASATHGAHTFRPATLAGTIDAADTESSGLAQVRSRGVRNPCGRAWPVVARILRESSAVAPFPNDFVQEHQRRALDRHRARHFDSRVGAFGVPSRTDREPNARQRTNTRLYRLHSCGAPGADRLRGVLFAVIEVKT